MIKFSETPQVYAKNALMCINGGVVASYSYSYALQLATAITGSYIKFFSSIAHHLFKNAILYFLLCLLFVIGILFTILLKRKVSSKTNQQRIALYAMIFCYLSLIIINFFFPPRLLNEYQKLYYLLPITLSSSVQYNMFGYMDNVQPATMFITNNFRQVCIRFIKSKLDKDENEFKLALLFLFSIIFFTLGLIVGFAFYETLNVYLFAISILICLVCLFL